ncbi:hypothetical protein V3C99_010728 [Haemonchus contortus]
MTFVSYSILFDRNVLCYVLVAFTSIFVYSNTFTADFVYDDSQAIVSNPVVTGDVPAVQAWSLDFWGHPLSRGSHKSYRPLTSLSFRLNALIFGMKPLSFHVTNVLLHAMASCLLLFFIQRFRFFSGNLESALFAALLFAVHPIHCEAVAGVVGRADVLVSIAVLAGIVLYDKVQSTLVAAISTAVAICFKETGIMLPPLLVAFLLLKPVKNYMELRRSISGLFLVFLTMVTIRHSINSFEAPNFSKSDNPVAHHPSMLTRSLTFLYLPVFHLQLLCHPKTLSFDWSMDAIPLVVSPLDSRFMASMAFYSSLLLTGCALIQASGIVEDLLRVVKPKKSGAGRKGCRSSRNLVANCSDVTEISRMFLLALSLLILPYIPSSNLFFYVGFVAAERILYLPSVGYCILVGMLYHICRSRFGKKSAVSFGFLILVLHGMKTYERNMDWKNEESLYKSALELNPPKAYSNLGRVYASQMRLGEAEAAYRNALAYRPNMADTWYNLGVLYQDMRKFSESVKCYRASINFRRTFATAHLNLGIVYETLGNDESAISTWQLCSTIDGTLVKAQREHRNAQTSCRFRLGRMLLSQGNLHEAEKVLDEAIREAPRSYPFIHSLLYSYGEVAKLLGKNDKAEQLFQAAFNAAPTHIPTLLTMAHLRNKQNRTSESNEWFSKALAVAPKSADIHHHIGLAAASRGDVARAEMAYKNALKLVSTHADSLKSLAALLREQHRYDKSEEVLRTLMNHHPTSETLSDYGAILHLNGKLDEAKRFYEKSLMLDPSNNVAKENLRRLERKLSSSTRHT